jgi:alkaline phosphatase
MAATDTAPDTNPDGSPAARNVILMIADGAGPTTWDAASYYRHGALGHEVYDDFAVHRHMSTNPLNTSTKPTGTAEATTSYDPARAWSAVPDSGTYEGSLGDYPNHFAGYDYLRQGVTDSAAAGTALASGERTYNNAINYDNFGKPLTNIGDLVVESGRELGIVSSVQWSHATPAAFGAHNANRNNYAEIAREMVEGGKASVIMGGGHPLYDSDGEARTPKSDDYRYVGGEETFRDLVGGRTDYRFIDSRKDFEALADGRLKVAADDKVIGTFRSGSTLQFDRDGVGMGELNENVPSLATMAEGALNVLGDDPDGFFLMVEGGAVDWAAHANNLPRIVQEQIAFNEAVESVVDWVETNSSWEETLVIVTSDHGNGLLLGPDSDDEAFQPIVNQGQGAMPLVRWHSDNHVNELVPLWANGAGSELVTEAATRTDPGLAHYGVEGAAQRYLDNTQVFDVMTEAMGIDADEAKNPASAKEPVGSTALAAQATANSDDIWAA